MHHPPALPEVALQRLSTQLIPALVDAFCAANWHKPAEIFETYLDEQDSKQRLVWVACKNKQITGYITLKWHSLYLPFQEQNIPEIMDFNVLPAFRRQGIGSALLACAEQHAFAQHQTIGLGVGLYADYGQALKLYVKHGYWPDGLGVTYDYQSLEPGATVRLDDDLVLWFTKTRGS